MYSSDYTRNSNTSTINKCDTIFVVYYNIHYFRYYLYLTQYRYYFIIKLLILIPKDAY